MSEPISYFGRALPANVRALIFGLEQTFDCAFHSFAGTLFSTTLAPLSVNVEIDVADNLLRVYSTLRRADPRLGADALYALLVRSFPEAALAGAGVRPGRTPGALDVIHEMRLAMTAPAAAAHIAEHARFARAFDDWLAQRDDVPRRAAA